MGDFQKIIGIVIGLFITIMIGAFAILGYNTFKNKGDELLANGTSMIDTLNTSRYENLNGEIVKGSEVLNFITECEAIQDPVFVRVAHGAASVDYVHNGGTNTRNTKTAEAALIVNAKDPANAAYINPTVTYKATLQYDTATGGESLQGIIFTRQ